MISNVNNNRVILDSSIFEALEEAFEASLEMRQSDVAALKSVLKIFEDRANSLERAYKYLKTIPFCTIDELVDIVDTLQQDLNLSEGMRKSLMGYINNTIKIKRGDTNG